MKIFDREFSGLSQEDVKKATTWENSFCGK